jgi:hypothetical protein
MDIWNILWTFGILYDHFAHCVFIWYIFSYFGVIHQEKSGNPGRKPLKQEKATETFCHAKKLNGGQIK